MRRAAWRRSVAGGALAGLIGGIVMSLYFMVTNAMRGANIWAPLKGAASPFIHQRAMRPGFDLGAILAGQALHLLVAVLWGIAFGILFYGLTRVLTFLAGIAWGLVVWLVMYYAVLPAVGLGRFVRSAPVGPAIAMHVLFGIVVALAFLPFQRAVYFRRTLA